MALSNGFVSEKKIQVPYQKASVDFFFILCVCMCSSWHCCRPFVVNVFIVMQNDEAISNKYERSGRNIKKNGSINRNKSEMFIWIYALNGRPMGPFRIYIHMYAMLRLQQLHRHERKRAHGQEMVERMKEIYTQTRRGSKQTIWNEMPFIHSKYTVKKTLYNTVR